MSSDACLDEFIDSLNGTVTNRKLSFQVKKALCPKFVYIINITELDLKPPFNNYDHFLIKKDKKYVGIVMGGSCELHWYLKPDYRGKGLMTKALNKYIIPNLLATAESVTISINEGDTLYFQQSYKLALRVGFKITKNDCLLEECAKRKIEDSYPCPYGGCRRLRLEIKREDLKNRRY